MRPREVRQVHPIRRRLHAHSRSRRTHRASDDSATGARAGRSSPGAGCGKRRQAARRAESRRRPAMRGAGRAALLLLFTLAVGAAALAYPLLARQWEWLGVSWQNRWLLLLLVAVPLAFWRGT